MQLTKSMSDTFDTIVIVVRGSDTCPANGTSRTSTCPASRTSISDRSGVAAARAPARPLLRVAAAHVRGGVDARGHRVHRGLGYGLEKGGVDAR